MRTRTRKNGIIVCVIVAAVLAVGLPFLFAGNLEPTASPSSTMHTLEDIYNLGASMDHPIGFIGTGASSFDMFVQINGISGESKDSAHQDWIDALWFDSMVDHVHMESGSCPKLSLRIVKAIDKATPHLLLKCCTGDCISDIAIEFCITHDTKACFFKVELENARISSVQPILGTGSNGFYRLEAATMTFERITWTYTELDLSGNPGANIETTWDLTSCGGPG